MTLTGFVLILVGLAIGILGIGQFLLTLALDPDGNYPINGILMVLSVPFGGLLMAIGAIIALIGRATGRDRSRGAS